MYGIVFIILGNLSGNAVSFGTYVMEAAGAEPTRGAVRGIAIAALTLAIGIHGSYSHFGSGLLSLSNLADFLKCSHAEVEFSLTIVSLL